MPGPGTDDAEEDSVDFRLIVPWQLGLLRVGLTDDQALLLPTCASSTDFNGLSQAASPPYRVAQLLPSNSRGKSSLPAVTRQA